MTGIQQTFYLEGKNFLIQIYEKLRKFIIVAVRINKDIETFPSEMRMFVLNLNWVFFFPHQYL